MNEFLLNKRNAIIITALIVVISVFAGATRTLNSLRNQAMLTFENGVQRDGVSVANDMKKRAAAAYDIALIAEKYYGENETTKELKELSAKEEKDISKKFKINEK